MYLMRGMAAGDVKLMAATGTWLSVPLNFRTRSSAILVAATDIPFGTSIEARHLASVGVATFNALHADAVEELPRVADHALALAKRAGKDRYVISSRASAAEVVRSL
jgi:predicted signal transduction protein with EAL and GGDEF domain